MGEFIVTIYHGKKYHGITIHHDIFKFAQIMQRIALL